MSLQLASELAAQLSPYRRLFLTVALTSFVVLLAVPFLSHTSMASNLSLAAMGPLVIVPWGLLCLCAWFGPNARFNAASGSVRAARRALSWYAELLLLVCIAGGVVWPFLVLFA